MEENSEEYRQDLQERINQDPIRRDTDGELWNKIIGEIEAIEKKEKRVSFYWYAAAASVMIILSAGLTYFYSSRNVDNSDAVVAHKIEKKEIEIVSKTDTIGAEKVLVKTDPANNQPETKTVKQEVFKTSNEVESQRLSDGSEITLNQSGSVKIRTFPDNDLLIDLSGEAYFDVVPGLNRSFKVNFGSSKLEVIGTKFSVRNIVGESLQEVLVSEGIVRVTTKNCKEVILKKGSYLQVDNETGAYEVKNVNPSHYLSWKTGSLNFEDTPLSEVATVLSRVYKTNIVAVDSIKSCTFTGDLSQMSLKDALEVIKATTSTEINSNTKNVIKISGDPCN